MGVLSVYHPDIIEFVTAKSKDSNMLTQFNISVMVDDVFMYAVKNDKSIYLHYPVYNKFGKLEQDENKWKYKKEYRARDLWNIIIKESYNTGEPGVLQYDNMNRDNNLWYVENIVGTNPCFTGDMELLTVNGYKRFDELCGENDLPIIDINGNVSEHNKVWKSGIKETVVITTSTNKKIKCTPDHIFMLNNGEECEAKNLKGKRIKRYYNKKSNNNFDAKFMKLGFIQGDGNLGRLRSNHHKGIEVNIGKKDLDVKLLFNDDEYTEYKNNRTIYIHGYNEIMNELGFSKNILPNRNMPETYNEWNIKQKASFIRGMYSANGCVVVGHRISYKTTCYNLAVELQEALLEFGIESNVVFGKGNETKFYNGEYLCKDYYNININKIESIIKFAEEIGFIHSYKNNRLYELIDLRSDYVLSVVNGKTEDVYDFTENNYHWGVVNGVVVHNCGEYLAGTLYESGFNSKLFPKNKEFKASDYAGACNLGSIFLHRFVLNPFTKFATLNYTDLTVAIKTMVRLLDNVIDVNIFPSEVYKNYQQSFRTIGLGVTGFADMLAMLGYRYNTKEAYEFTDELFNMIAYTAYEESIELAKEKGSFPMLDADAFIDSGFIEKHIKWSNEKKYSEKYDWNKIADGIRKYGIRNARLLSVAPTGTLSLSYGNNCSSGIEPIFQLEYQRKVRIGGQSEENEKIITLRDYAWEIVHGMEGIIIDPDIFVTALDMSVDDHIDMLGNIAKHIDMSVSKTCNVPSDYPFEDTKDIYMKCWKKGIKGITIFRPNPIREGILLSDTKESKELPQNTPKNELKRGDILSVSDDLIGYKRKIVNGCGDFSYKLFFDDFTGEPLESYISMGDGGGCSKNLEAISRLISLCLRVGVPVEEVIKQLKKVKACRSYGIRQVTSGDCSKGSSCPSAIGFAMEELNEKIKEKCFADFDNTNETEEFNATIRQIESEPKKNTGDGKYTCPECGKELIHEGGCVVCECGWTKCE